MGTSHQLHAHLIFSTQGRRRLLNADAATHATLIIAARRRFATEDPIGSVIKTRLQ